MSSAEDSGAAKAGGTHQPRSEVRDGMHIDWDVPITMDDGLVLRGAIPLQMPLRIWCYRAAVTGGAPAAILEHWRWEISIWTPEDRKKFDDAMKAAYETIK